MGTPEGWGCPHSGVRSADHPEGSTGQEGIRKQFEAGGS